MHGPDLFGFFNDLISTDESKVLYILSLVCLFMMIDFIIGSIAAWRDKGTKFSSQVGINGILRKVGSMLVLVACIPVSVLIPANAGIAALYVLYTGYLVMEFVSVVENLDKLGADVSKLQAFIENFNKKEGNE